MVEVFKTNITNDYTANILVAELRQLYPFSAISFDLEDCDRILRVKGETVHPDGIIKHLESKGYNCAILD